MPAGVVGAAHPATWILHGAMSNLRYATQGEVISLKSKQEGLGRAQASRAVLIPIRKSAVWWALAQDERRSIFEENSHHTSIGLGYLPNVARQLYHARSWRAIRFCDLVRIRAGAGRRF